MSGLTIRIAAAQMASITAETVANLSAAKTIVIEAGRAGVNLVVFPELFTSGYNAGAKFCELAEPLDGQSFQFMSTLAAQHNIALCYGYPERLGDQIFNSAQFIDDKGSRLINHRKTHLYGDYEKQWFASGDEHISSVSYRGFTLSTLICYEIEFPELARANAQSGANIILVPTATTEANNPEQVAQLLVRARAAENNVYVVYVNHAAGEEHMSFNGRSLIAGPFGKVYVSSDNSKAGLIYADIHASQIDQSAGTNPYLLDLRSDLFVLRA